MYSIIGYTCSPDLFMFCEAIESYIKIDLILPCLNFGGLEKNTTIMHDDNGFTVP